MRSVWFVHVLYTCVRVLARILCERKDSVRCFLGAVVIATQIKLSTFSLISNCSFDCFYEWLSTWTTNNNRLWDSFCLFSEFLIFASSSCDKLQKKMNKGKRKGFGDFILNFQKNFVFLSFRIKRNFFHKKISVKYFLFHIFFLVRICDLLIYLRDRIFLQHTQYRFSSCIFHCVFSHAFNLFFYSDLCFLFFFCIR